MSSPDFLIVGAGITGLVLAERLDAAGASIVLMEQRGHIGGNCFDEPDERDVLVQRYGPHIYHTSNAEVHEYLCRFTEWRAYTHTVKAQVGAGGVPIPCNLGTLEALLSGDEGGDLIAALVADYGEGAEVTVAALKRDHRHSRVAEVVWNTLFQRYTQKQWGEWASSIAEDVFSRVPIRLSRDDRYFRDAYQGLPVCGFTALFQNMLAGTRHIEVRLGTPASSIRDSCRPGHVIYSGSIDEYYSYEFGRLPYRTMDFQCQEVGPGAPLQAAPVVNYVDDRPATRCAQYPLEVENQSQPRTLCVEFPRAAVDKNDVPMYPIPSDTAVSQYARYAAKASEDSTVTFCGRLGSYEYLNIDDAVRRALDLAKRLVDPS